MTHDFVHFRESHGKHVGPVWQIRWIEKERGSGEERTEVLISISTDGRVTQWSIRKGFESYGKCGTLFLNKKHYFIYIKNFMKDHLSIL